MAIRLAQPVTIETLEGMSGVANQAQFGCTIQPYNGDPYITVYEVLGNVKEKNGQTEFVPMVGIRPDGKRSDNTVSAERAEAMAFLAHPDVQKALGAIVELYRYLDSDRDEAMRPSWVPAPAA